MQRKITVVALSAMLFALCCPAEAQQPKKVPRIGIYLRSIQLVSPPVSRKDYGGLRIEHGKS